MTGRLEKFSKWFQLKIYQLEVTLSVYMFTPNEKFIFYSVLFLLLSLTFIACILYLPQHVQFILGRAWFYMNGDDSVFAHQSQLVKSVLMQQGQGASTATTAAQAVKDTLAAAAGGFVKGEL